MGLSLVGALLYVRVRRLRRQPQQQDSAHKGSGPGTTRYEKPELSAEDAYKVMDIAARRTAEQAGDQDRVEIDGIQVRHTGTLKAV